MEWKKLAPWNWFRKEEEREGPVAFDLRPSLDISEGRNAYTIQVEVPGADKGDVSVEVDRGTLVIRGEKKRERVEEGEDYHCVERAYGVFERLLSLPEDSDTSGIQARFRRGVLSVTVPKQGRKTEPRHTIAVHHD